MEGMKAACGSVSRNPTALCYRHQPITPMTIWEYKERSKNANVNWWKMAGLAERR